MSVNNEPHQGWDVKAETEDDKSASNTVADSKKKRSWKKPKDKPMRPLSAYNMFFRKYKVLPPVSQGILRLSLTPILLARYCFFREPARTHCRWKDR